MQFFVTPLHIVQRHTALLHVRSGGAADPSIAAARRSMRFHLGIIAIAVVWTPVEPIGDVHAPYRLPPDSFKLGLPLAKGAFGTVLYACGPEGQRCVAKRASTDKGTQYLIQEAVLNSRLAENAAGSRHLAPFLGVCRIGWVDHIIWAASPGVEHSLDWYISGATVRSLELAAALGIETRGPAELDSDAMWLGLLRAMLSCVALLHMNGVSHRDVKPENLLVDTRTRSLRLIDLGSACTMHGASDMATIPTTSAWAPPELRLTQSAPWAYDVYSTALVWLRGVLHSSTSSRKLLALRAALMTKPKDDIGMWLASTCADEVGCDFQDEETWRVVGRMLETEPSERVSALEILCSATLPSTPEDEPAPSSSTAICLEDQSCSLPLAEDTCMIDFG